MALSQLKKSFFVVRYNGNIIFFLAQGERASLQHADEDGRNPVANVGPVQCLSGEFILRGIRGWLNPIPPVRSVS
jgi:hypothetical protein